MKKLAKISEEEKLEIFKVDELEARLEVGNWSCWTNDNWFPPDPTCPPPPSNSGCNFNNTCPLPEP